MGDRLKNKNKYKMTNEFDHQQEQALSITQAINSKIRATLNESYEARYIIDDKWNRAWGGLANDQKFDLSKKEGNK